MIMQMELISGMMRLLDRLEPGIALLPRQINAVISAADAILAELRTPERTVQPAMGLAAWLASDCTGASSLYMAHVLAGYWAQSAHKYNYPRDSGDFGRCLGLLLAVPDLQKRLPVMAEYGPEWAALIAEWDSLAADYGAGKFDQVSKRIRALVRPAHVQA